MLAFDLDGTLTPRNQLVIHPLDLADLLNELSLMGHFVIPVTGKPVDYVAQIFPKNNLIDHGVIVENAEVYRQANSDKIKVYG
ncbi:HAD hydrolase family protein [Candidatus Beckwithbacteria bacterium]|nr:HAD hydrolase family protein [Candidatus Beckwithbacteria bacterium]